MRIGSTAHIKLLPDRNVWFQGYSGLRKSAARTGISSQNRTLMASYKIYSVVSI